MRILSFFLLVAFAGCTDQSTAQTKLSPNDFEAKIKAEPAVVQLVDVRTPEEFAAGHLEGAVNYNFYDDDFQQKIARLDKNRPVLVYCAVGGRSGSAAGQLAGMGFTKVFDLSGGIKAWKAQGKKTVQ